MYVKRILPNGVRLITERIDNMRTVPRIGRPSAEPL